MDQHQRLLDCVAFMLIKNHQVLAEKRKPTKKVVPGALALPGGLKAGAVASIDNRDGAVISFDNASRYAYSTWIPGWLPTLFTGNDVNQAGAGVAAFLAGYTAGLGGVMPTNGFSDDLTSLLKAKKSIRK